MNNKVITVAKFEFLKQIKSPLFWFATLFFPLFMGLIFFLTSYSTKVSQQNLNNNIEDDIIYVVDNSGLISDNQLVGNLIKSDTKEQPIRLVESNQASGLIVFGNNFVNDYSLEIYYNSDNILKNPNLDLLASNLIKNSILEKIPDQNFQKLFLANYNIKQTNLSKIGEDSQIKKLVLAGIGVILYFIMIIFGSRFMLTSISEEKENRLIEVLLTNLSSKQLIFGKILGIMGLIFLQILLLLIGGFIVSSFIDNSFIISKIKSIGFIGFIDIIKILFYLIVGLLTFSFLLIGVGAAAPNAKEASGLSTPFIILTIIPIYISGILITDPSGIVAIIFSYLPITSPLLLLFRSLIGELSILEFVFSSIIVLFYLFITYLLAIKIFQRGSMEFNNRLSFKDIFK